MNTIQSFNLHGDMEMDDEIHRFREDLASVLINE